MKHLNKISYFKNLGIILSFLILAACGSKDAKEISFKSADGKTTIFINGKKPSFGDPWQTQIKIKTLNDEQELVTEIFASELNEENVKLNWESNEKCKLVFSQQDDTQRNFLIEADTTHIRLVEE
jgi:hypothetical protein